ncbi:MAG: 2OG-Fe(II) oxygenase [Myxococcales bacterium]|nr:2OG-Fe(II) oxygenase [Myxococcales bacterium]
MNDTELSRSLASRGYAVREGFVDEAHIAALAAEARELYREGRFRRAGIGASRKLARDIRGDEIWWIDIPTAEQARYLARLAELASEVNRALLLGLISVECHLARYAAGLGYDRHRDRQQGDDARVLSCTLYLNDDWQPEDGGQLRLHPPGEPALDVLPRAGTMACFLSDELEHEVLPARRARWSLTSWLRRRSHDPLDARGIPLVFPEADSSRRRPRR